MSVRNITEDGQKYHLPISVKQMQKYIPFLEEKEKVWDYNNLVYIYANTKIIVCSIHIHLVILMIISDGNITTTSRGR